LPDGNIEFLGRIDHQVKVRGFRIELGEIEAVLVQHPAIAEAVAVAREEVPGEKCLVAYVVPREEPAPTTSDLRHLLKQKLPDYMVPGAFVFLSSLPLTPNGKVNRSALPAPDQSRPELKEAFVAPHSPAEETVAGIWENILGRRKIGIHDNFFDLGGHSLLATQVVSRLSEVFHIDLPLRILFEKPTVAELAAVLSEKQTTTMEPSHLSSLLTELESMSDEQALESVVKETGETDQAKGAGLDREVE
jgi:acyl carrier protein